ncbi:MAG: TetR/AcrR family transcriptional regulator [Chloroflexota bacterium]|nr:TetR/AcrR family transcriptional regulator [Chloroflexota bacterium]
MIERSRRDELLEKAAHLFRAKGYHATSMKDIAAELEILPGSLYHHIDSKESLLVEIMQRGIEVLLEYVRPVVASDAPPIAKLRDLVRFHIIAIAEHPDVLTVFLHEMKSLPEARRQEQLQLRDEYERLLMSVIEEGIACGDFRPLHPRMATFAILGMVNWLYAWYRPTGSLSPDEIADEFLTLIVQGLATEETREGERVPSTPPSLLSNL